MSVTSPSSMSIDAVSHRRFFCLAISSGSFLAWSILGCGSPSESTLELTEEGKKADRSKKIGDESKFRKTGKGGGKRT